MAVLELAADVLAHFLIIAIALPTGAFMWVMLQMHRLICLVTRPAAAIRSAKMHTARLDVVDVCGITTETLSWDAKQPAQGSPSALEVITPVLAKTVLVMYPGNPGAVDFYAPFLEEVHRLSGHRISIVCVGHASHSSRTAEANGRALISFQQQVQHKNAVVQALHTRYPDARFVLAGHSIGAYMALECMRHLPSSSVLRAIGITPTLAWIGRTINGRKLMPLFEYGRGIMWLAAHCARVLPTSVQHWFVRFRLPAGTDPLFIPVTASLLHPMVAYNTLYMALQEMQEMAGLDEEHLKAVESKVRLFFAPNDAWVNAEDVRRLSDAFPRVQSKHSTDPTDVHAYVLFPQASNRMAQYVWDCIAEAVQEEAAAPSPSGRPVRRGSVHGERRGERKDGDHNDLSLNAGASEGKNGSTLKVRQRSVK